MKLSLNYLSELTGLTLNHEELRELIDTSIGEVEDVIDLSKKYNGILIAEIVAVSYTHLTLPTKRIV